MSNKNIEVEIRALVTDVESIRKGIVEAGGLYQGSYHLHDIYFCRKSSTKLKEVEMDEVGSYGLRLRRSQDPGKAPVTSINSKSIISKGDHNAWEEHETSVGSFTEMAKILALTEFKPFFELEKTRHRYSLSGKDIGIFVEEIVGFGGCIEVEKMTMDGEQQDAKQEILKLLRELGINDEDIVPKSITNIIMKERAFVQKISL